MKTPKRILVVISGRHTEHPALERALKFAELDDIHIHLFNSIYEPVMELTDVLSSEHRKEMKSQYMADRYLYMDTLADDLDQKGISCSVNVAWHRELHEAIEEIVNELEPDLVIKCITADRFNINPFAMPVDRHLLRYCKAPLLLIRDSHWVNKPILAAIDPTVRDTKHIALNHNILEYSKMLAQVTKTQLHSVNTFETPNMGPSMDVGWANIDFQSIKVDTTNAHKNKMETLLKEHDLFINPYHVLEGRADIVIPDIAKKIDAQLLILGTVGRTGLSGAFIGNTAEHILANMNCDILTLKPNL
ncbi:universal stress protein UspE [Paraglaciecola sp. MB-3u-78]|uniref:universal stress protein UspE n=1 Tax=Paraglaciecola sp. MB-3u-78 TaxID=2058332 RepID=UPI000C340908|nr:universal stress protein UspE [Paraglaciecola sp. MB-3u-78]PKG99219.1 universal stress protein UspE [Paraglaciecola sp. MB-3u-78]